MLLLLTAGLVLAGVPRLVHAFRPVIAVPAYAQRVSKDVQPLAAFRSPAPFAAKTIANDNGAATLKWFLTDRSPLDDAPPQAPALKVSAGPPRGVEVPAVSEESEPNVVAPTLGLTFEPSPETLPPPIKTASASQTMPGDVAEAVKLLLRKDSPDSPPRPDAGAAKPPTIPPTIPPPVDPATQAAVAYAVKRLGNSAPPAAKETPVPPPKAAAIDRAIAILKGDPAAPSTPIPSTPILPRRETPPVIVVPNVPVFKYSAEEEQDAIRLAVAREAAQLLDMLPEPAPLTLPPLSPVANLPEPTPASSTCVTCGRDRGLGLGIRDEFHKLKHYGDKFGGCSTCGGGWRCSPGHPPCEPCEAHDGPLGRLFCDFYECLCCPDPCYEPTWRQVPNAALFVDGARPVTQTEIRWNGSRSGSFPDRSEYLWARADGRGRGPRPPNGRIAEIRFDYDDLVLITETAKDKLSAIVEMPYRAISPDTYAHGAGFGDMAIGTKTLLFDCELLQVSMQMKTYLPVGNPLKGVGTGHVSLEPSLLFALKLHHDCYVQGQLSEWIPIGGDPSYMGSIFHTHFSFNHVVHRFGPDIPLVGTMEVNTFSFQDGAYTDPILGAFQKSSDTTYVSLGPGLRLFFCDKLDIGFGAAFSVTGEHFSREYYRTSVRLRF